MIHIYNNVRLLRRYIILYYKNLLYSPVNIFMNFFLFLFNILSIILFWYSLTNMKLMPMFLKKEKLIYICSFNILSEGINRIFWGFRDLEYQVMNGRFDKFLIRTTNPFLSLILEKINLLMVIGYITIYIASMIYISIVYHLSLYKVIISTTICVFSSIAFSLIYGIFSLLTFWYGKIYTAREIVFSIQKVKQYPLDLFPLSARRIFTYIIPIAFLSFLPSEILFSRKKIFLIFSASTLLMVLSIFAFKMAVRKALRRYTSIGC